ncbi:MAG: DUF1949 domain-containing protein [Lacunisphaera sp.]|jgi:hypothetical protein|nr:DUF1949 domain-containing protein [Lacunisphaera sp.]
MNVKVHLDYAEYDPLKRTAEALGCEVEDVVYTAINEYMLRLGNFKEHCGPECKKIHTDFASMRAEVHNQKLARKNNLPKWADSAGSAHNYEGFGPDEPTKSSQAKF